MESDNIVNIDNLVLIHISKEMGEASDYFANKRILFEFPRSGYGAYDQSHIVNIKNGYLGELAFLEYLIKYLNEKHENLQPNERFDAMSKLGVSYELIIGRTQNYDFKINNKTVDVKTYGTKIIENKEEALQYNLFIDVTQHTTCDIYIQAFIMSTEVILAGYHIGVPKDIIESIPHPAHKCPVQKLEKIANIFNDLQI